jgi:hypothetical protein
VKVIGICGQKRHGKDTVGQMLQEDFGYTPIALADPIKRIAMDVYGFTYEQCYGDEKEVPDPMWDGLTPRRALQIIGTEMGRTLHPETWLRYCFSTMEAAERGDEPLIHVASERGFVPAINGHVNVEKWVITDIRFLNEADMVRSKRGQVFQVVRPSLVGTQGDTHASETSLADVEPDHTFINDGTLADLRAKVLLHMRP